MAVMNGGRMQKVGSPTEIYDQPANRFVAGFIAEMNVLQGYVDSGSFDVGAACRWPPYGIRHGKAIPVDADREPCSGTPQAWATRKRRSQALISRRKLSCSRRFTDSRACTNAAPSRRGALSLAAICARAALTSRGRPCAWS